MLDEKALGLLQLATRWNYFIGTIPVSWRRSEIYVTFNSSWKRHCFFIFQLSLLLSYQSFVIIRWIYATYFDPTAPDRQKVALQYIALSYMIPVPMQLLTFSRYEELHSLINMYFNHGRNFEAMMGESGFRKCYKMLRVCFAVGIAITMGNILSLFVRPAAPHLVTSLIDGVVTWPKWALIPFAIFHGYIWCGHWSVIVFYLSLLLTYITAVHNMLESLKFSHDTADEGGRPNLTAAEFYMETRMLQNLHSFFNYTARTLLWAIQVLGVYLCIYSIFTAVRVDGFRKIHITIIAFSALLIINYVYLLLGEIYETSVGTLESWNHVKVIPWFRRFTRSTKPIAIELGHFYYADKPMLITMLAIIFENTFNLLMTSSFF